MKYIDMHCDTVAEMYYRKRDGRPYSLYENDQHIDIKKLMGGHCMLQCFAAFTDLMRDKDPFTYVNGLIDVFYEQTEKHGEYIRPVVSVGQIEENSRAGIISALLTVEEGGVIENDISRVQKLYDRGVRMMNLTWNYKNSLSTPNGYRASEGERDGLTPLGYEFLSEAQRLGIIVDISHISDAGLWDVIGEMKKPFVASHSNCRALCDNPRNLDDDMLRAMAEHGCVAGINFCSSFIHTHTSVADYGVTAERAVNHIMHMIKVAGENFPAIGTDYDGVDSLNLEMKDASYMPLLEKEMRRRGLGEEQIEKVMYKNVLAVCKEIIG